MNATAIPRDWRPPAFLLRGARLVTSNSECRGYIATQIEPQAAQEARLPLGGPLSTSEPEKAVPEPPSPAVSASEADREAALAKLAQISVLSAEAAAELKRLAKVVEDAKQGIGSGGLALTIQLRKLMAKYGLRTENPPPLPLLPPIDAPSIKIKGLAATSSPDLDRTCFASTCWSTLDASKIKLCVGHDLDREVGSLDQIDVDYFGRVTIVATVTDKQAMQLPGLSISAMVEQWTLRNPEDRFSFAGEVTKVSSVNEISLSSTPSNRQCLVLDRWIPEPYELSFGVMIGCIQRMQALALAMKEKGLLAA